MVAIADETHRKRSKNTPKKAQKQPEKPVSEVVFGAPVDSFLAGFDAKKARPTVPLPAESPVEIVRTPAENDGIRGLECPNCGCRHLPVKYTRPKLKRRQRVRECRNCGREVVTYEKVANTEGS